MAANWFYAIVVAAITSGLWVSVDVMDPAIILMNLIYFTYIDKFPAEVQGIILLLNVMLIAKVMIWKPTTQNTA